VITAISESPVAKRIVSQRSRMLKICSFIYLLLVNLTVIILEPNAAMPIANRKETG